MSVTTEQAAKYLRDVRAKMAQKIGCLPPLMQDRTELHSVVEALDMAIGALQEKEEREVPRLLTLEELEGMEEDPFYVRIFDLDEPEYPGIVFPAISDNFRDKDVAIWCGDERAFLSFDDYYEKWVAYRHRPKEVQL